MEDRIRKTKPRIWGRPGLGQLCVFSIANELCVTQVPKGNLVPLDAALCAQPLGALEPETAMHHPGDTEGLKKL